MHWEQTALNHLGQPTSLTFQQKRINFVLKSFTLRINASYISLWIFCTYCFPPMWRCWVNPSHRCNCSNRALPMHTTEQFLLSRAPSQDCFAHDGHKQIKGNRDFIKFSSCAKQWIWTSFCPFPAVASCCCRAFSPLYRMLNPARKLLWKNTQGKCDGGFSSLISLLTLFPSFLPSPPCRLNPQPIDVKGKTHTDLMWLWITLLFLGHLFL